MNAKKFNEDFEFYKNNLSKKLDEQRVGIMLHAYCMGYCGMAGHVLEEFDMTMEIDPVLEKISGLNHYIKSEFENHLEHSKQTEWGGSIHLMERNGDAYVHLYYYDEDRNTVFIEGLSVSEPARKKGLGTKYLNMCEDIGRAMKATVCCLSVKKDSWMYDWYSRKGYYWAGINDNQKDEVWMKKEL